MKSFVKDYVFSLLRAASLLALLSASACSETFTEEGDAPSGVVFGQHDWSGYFEVHLQCSLPLPPAAPPPPPVVVVAFAAVVASSLCR